MIPRDRPKSLLDISFLYVFQQVFCEAEERVEIDNEGFYPGVCPNDYIIVVCIHRVDGTMLTEHNLSKVGLTWLDLLSDDDL